MSIPRIIHQIWFKVGNGPASPPEQYTEMIASWRTKHPDWTFMQWDREEADKLIATHYPAYKTLFDGYQREIYRIDAIRYFILHHYGGFYVDTDVTCYSSIEKLRKYPVVLSKAQHAGFFMNNHFMGGIPKHPFFQACLENLTKSRLIATRHNSFSSTMTTAGPIYLSIMTLLGPKKKELYIMDLPVESIYYKHHENNTWLFGPSVANDLIVAGIGAGLLGGVIYFAKKGGDEKI